MYNTCTCANVSIYSRNIIIKQTILIPGKQVTQIYKHDDNTNQKLIYKIINNLYIVYNIHVVQNRSSYINILIAIQ